MPIIQQADNPHDWKIDPAKWAQHERKADGGSMQGLMDYAKRNKLYDDLQIEGTSQKQLAAWKYLLRIE